MINRDLICLNNDFTVSNNTVYLDKTGFFIETCLDIMMQQW